MKIKDKKQLMKLVSFLAMSDGSIHHNGGSKNCVFSFSQTEDHSDFVDFAREVVENITSSTTYRQDRELPRKSVLKLQTKSHPYFNALRGRIYVGNYKSLDFHALKLLDFEALAILHMADGCLGKHIDASNKVSYTTTLNMCRLSYGDLVFLKRVLKDRLDLEWNVVKTGKSYFCLRLRSKDHDKFIDGVAPYILPSFRYKIDFRTATSRTDGEIV